MVEERVQRRLAAILAADVVAYSRLVEIDEEGTRARLRALSTGLIEPQIASDGGRVVKALGDGFLVEFASAVDAVRNALAIQSAIAGINSGLPEDKRMLFRVGINLGDVIIEGDDIHGDGVNVAARLETACEPGAVFVSGSVFDQVTGKVEATFEDLGEQRVKNIARPIRVYRAGPISRVSDFSIPGAASPLPEKPSIAVLPFDNMSGDPEQAYFSDGITEDIITELSRFRTIFVIARNSAFMFRGPNVDVKEVGDRLGVQYAVEGSVRKAGNRIRVTAQLVECETGRHLWADRYDRDLEDIFAVQDEITQTIVSILPGRLEDAALERAQRKHTPNLTAYDFVLLGIERVRRLAREDNVAARELFARAIELDPQYARAHANLAWTYTAEAFMDRRGGSTLENALGSIDRALVLDNDDSWFHAVRGQILFALGRDQEAEIHARRGLILNQNDAETTAVIAPILVYMGRSQEGLEWIIQAKRLNPFPPRVYHWYHALACYSNHDYYGAVGAIKSMGMTNHRIHAYLAACYAQLNTLDEAHAELSLFLEGLRGELRESGDDPSQVTQELVAEWANRYRLSEDRDHFLDGLRKAGLLE